MEIESSKKSLSEAVFDLHVTSGNLFQLCKGSLTTLNLINTLPRRISKIRTSGSQSMLRLSNTAVLTSSSESVDVYNPSHQSLLASVTLEDSTSAETLKRKRTEPSLLSRKLKLVSYFPKLSTAVGILGNELVGIQINSSVKGRKAGLLIDSLGCAIPGHHRHLHSERRHKGPTSKLIVSLSASTNTASDEDWERLIEPLELALRNDNTEEFDDEMMEKLQQSIESLPPKFQNSDQTENKGSHGLQASSATYRQLVLFALSKIFTWADQNETTLYRLSITFYPPRTFAWLLQTGNMTKANIEAGIKHQIRRSSMSAIPSTELVDALVTINPEMDLLYSLVCNSFLDAAALLSIIRHLMNSLGLLGEQEQTNLLALKELENSDLESHDVEQQLRQMEAEAEAELELVEFQLESGSGLRGEALSLALSKLYTCPPSSLMTALHTTYSSRDIVALIYLFRVELARGAWTTRYLALEQSDVINDEAAIADNSIVLITTLLNACIDAVGAGGWLSGDTKLVDGNPSDAEELISSLRLEISAALEGIEESIYIRGLTSEMIRYGRGVERAQTGKHSENYVGPSKPLRQPLAEPDAKVLPLGLKHERQVPLLRVGLGGDVHERSLRDIGRLKSQKVEKYSFERIEI